jgi:hypothetical protein
MQEEAKVLKRKLLLVVALSTAIMVGPGLGTVFAGEVTGNGQPTAGPTNANSICVLLGEERQPDQHRSREPRWVSQSHGQELKLGFVDPHQFNPGDACRGAATSLGRSSPGSQSQPVPPNLGGAGSCHSRT